MSASSLQYQRKNECAIGRNGHPPERVAGGIQKADEHAVKMGQVVSKK